MLKGGCGHKGVLSANSNSEMMTVQLVPVNSHNSEDSLLVPEQGILMYAQNLYVNLKSMGRQKMCTITRIICRFFG